MTALPPFDAHGNLPPGDYSPREAEFTARFVEVAGTTSRPPIYQGWTRLRGELLAVGLDARAHVLLDGSYTTSKLDPGDLDLVVEVSVADVPRDGDPALAPLLGLLQGPRMKTPYRCDAYPVFVLPATHPAYTAVTVGFRAYWRKWLGTDRAGREKGRDWRPVRVDTAVLPQLERLLLDQTLADQEQVTQLTGTLTSASLRTGTFEIDLGEDGIIAGKVDPASPRLLEGKHLGERYDFDLVERPRRQKLTEEISVEYTLLAVSASGSER